MEPMKTKTMVVAMNFSELSFNAAEYATAMAKMSQAKLIIFHSFVVSIHAQNAHLSANNFQQEFEHKKQLLEQKARQLEERYAIEIITEISALHISDGINYMIEKYTPDLIVFGMTEKTLEQDLMGNITTSVIRDIRIPVMAVPLKAKFTGSKRIIFACDVLHELPSEVLKRIKETVETFHGEIEVFSVNEKINELKASNSPALALNSIDDGFAGIKYYYKNVRSKAIIKEIEKEIKEYNADLLIMVPKKYGFWESVVHRSKTRIMASGLDIPLLSIPL
tara:strand:+ start:70 stop:906 length:837 start_codon:yes stop_codon:yes gene_type:complete